MNALLEQIDNIFKKDYMMAIDKLKNWCWPYQRTSPMSGQREYACPHGVGHSKGVHGCDGCCCNASFDKVVKKPKNRSNSNEKKTR